MKAFNESVRSDVKESEKQIKEIVGFDDNEDTIIEYINLLVNNCLKIDGKPVGVELKSMRKGATSNCGYVVRENRVL